MEKSRCRAWWVRARPSASIFRRLFDMSRTASSLNVTGPAAMRALAQAFANFGEFNNFVKGLQTALDQMPHFERLTISVPAALAESSANFSSANLTLPLGAGAGPIGT